MCFVRVWVRFLDCTCPALAGQACVCTYGDCVCLFNFARRLLEESTAPKVPWTPKAPNIHQHGKQNTIQEPVLVLISRRTFFMDVACSVTL